MDSKNGMVVVIFEFYNAICNQNIKFWPILATFRPIAIQ